MTTALWQAAEADPLILRELELICGKPYVSARDIDRISYSRDAFPLAFKWIREGRIAYLPTYIVRPENAEQIQEIVRLCNREKIPYLPYGGGSGIVGAALPTKGGIVIDLKRMNRLVSVDDVSLVATVQAGAVGQHFEEALNSLGYTCGHYPQSIRQSTVGGWVAHCGVGTYSTKYGKIDDLVVALKVVLPDGRLLETRNVPKASTGPNLNQLFIGSEGVLGIVTEATVKIFPLPEEERFLSYDFPDFAAGIEAVRTVLRHDIRPAVVRLYDEIEARRHFSDLLGDSRCVLLFGAAGRKLNVEHEAAIIERLAREAGGTPLGSVVGEKWKERRFSTAGLCNTLRKRGGIADALEVTGSWSNLHRIYEAMKSAMEKAIKGRGEVFGHLSHAYHTGANLYMIFHAHDETDESAESLYYEVMEAAFDACQGLGGALSHHHGVGIGKARWMRRELGNGLDLLKSLKSAIDPDRLLNQGKLGI